MAFELDSPHTLDYLAAREGVPAEALRLTALGGGVSNYVILVETPARRYVLKQSLGRLRVAELWLSRRDRIWREAEALRLLAPLLPAGSVPEVLFEDRDNYLFAMSAASGGRNWKEHLLAGDIDENIAAAIGRIHAAMLRAHEGHAFDDLEVFDQLRLDPYYRFTASRHPDLASHFEAAIDRCQTRRTALVHGDWSPKNFLIDGSSAMAIDFEVIHYGDPAFDIAFLLNHLLLKSFFMPKHAEALQRVARRYWSTLSPNLELAAGTFEHLPLLMLARIDGKSPAEYIRDDKLKHRIRAFARALLGQPPQSIEAIFDRLLLP